MALVLHHVNWSERRGDPRLEAQGGGMEAKLPEIGAIEAPKTEVPLVVGTYVESTSASMRALEHIIADIAPTDIPVLLVGESGSGKEIIAQQIHALSMRKDEPFGKIRCAALAPEFFDRRSQENVPGGTKANPAENGSVFLDEINELDMTSQSKLLNFLPDGGVSPDHCLGSRVISATSRNLEEEMAAGRFREELYYRINGVCLRLPPLRQRKEDIPALVDFFLQKYSALFGCSGRSISPQSLKTLLDHNWPGNIRELENAIKKVVALCDDNFALAELSFSVPEFRVGSSAAPRPSLKQTARAASHVAERELILKVLAQTRWNRKRAARELQISYKALLYKLKQIGTDDSTGSLSPRREQR